MEKKETLNLDYHCKVLMLKALNKHKTIAEAAVALWMSERQLYRWMDEYEVVQMKVFVVKGNYELKHTL